MFDFKLSNFKPKIQKINNENNYEIFDIIRKKYIKLTPEELIRQQMVHYLIEKGYPKSLITIETGLNYNNKLKRSDIIVYKKTGEITILIECKAENVKLNKNVLDQICIYNKVKKAEFLVITNGKEYFCFNLLKDKSRYTSSENIPDFIYK